MTEPMTFLHWSSDLNFYNVDTNMLLLHSDSLLGFIPVEEQTHRAFSMGRH
jgi:hypothetical protein